jgi:hypothetical protein
MNCHRFGPDNLATACMNGFLQACNAGLLYF